MTSISRSTELCFGFSHLIFADFNYSRSTSKSCFSLHNHNCSLFSIPNASAKACQWTFFSWNVAPEEKNQRTASCSAIWSRNELTLFMLLKFLVAFVSRAFEQISFQLIHKSLHLKSLERKVFPRWALLSEKSLQSFPHAERKHPAIHCTTHISLWHSRRFWVVRWKNSFSILCAGIGKG